MYQQRNVNKEFSTFLEIFVSTMINLNEEFNLIAHNS